jgi:hypothetical protein
MNLQSDIEAQYDIQNTTSKRKDNLNRIEAYGS